MQIKKGCDFKKIDEQADILGASLFDVISLVFMLAACLVFVTYLSGCTLKISTDWHGETAKDEKIYSQKR